MNTHTALPIQQRSYAYGLFAAALDYPDKDMTALINQGTLADQCRETLCALYPELEQAIDWQALSQGGAEDDLAIEYSRLFDVGASGPPCPLYGGVYQDSRMPTLEEIVRFYNYFGLTASGGDQELPDHLSTQLEFLHYLSHCEEQLEQGEEVDDYRRAQRDFINRHPGEWLPKLYEKLQEQKATPFYQSLFELMCLFLRLEHQRLNVATARIATSAPVLS